MEIFLEREWLGLGPAGWDVAEAFREGDASEDFPVGVGDFIALGLVLEGFDVFGEEFPAFLRIDGKGCRDAVAPDAIAEGVEGFDFGGDGHAFGFFLRISGGFVDRSLGVGRVEYEVEDRGVGLDGVDFHLSHLERGGFAGSGKGVDHEWVGAGVDGSEDCFLFGGGFHMILA